MLEVGLAAFVEGDRFAAPIILSLQLSMRCPVPHWNPLACRVEDILGSQELLRSFSLRRLMAKAIADSLQD
jgi:hypothetical protein